MRQGRSNSAILYGVLTYLDYYYYYYMWNEWGNFFSVHAPTNFTGSPNVRMSLGRPRYMQRTLGTIGFETGAPWVKVKEEFLALTCAYVWGASFQGCFHSFLEVGMPDPNSDLRNIGFQNLVKSTVWVEVEHRRFYWKINKRPNLETKLPKVRHMSRPPNSLVPLPIEHYFKDGGFRRMWLSHQRWGSNL